MHYRLTKAERREKRRRKQRYGMKVTNTSVRLLAQLAVKPRKGKRK